MQIPHYSEANLALHLLSEEIKSVIQVEILDEVVYVSLCANSFGKDVKEAESNYFPSSYE